MLNKVIFTGSHSTTFQTFLFARKLINAMLFVEHTSKHYYVTNETMKRLHLFDIVLLHAGYVFFLYKKFNMSFNILLLLYGFHRFKEKMMTPAYF